MDKKIVSKVVDFILNLRRLNFNAATWSDVLASTGPLSMTDKTKLSQLLTGAGARLSGQNWDFGNLDIEILRTFPAMDANDALVSIILKVEAGAWWRTTAGKAKFVKDPNFSFSSLGNDDDEDRQSETKPRDGGTGESHLDFWL
jgi:hypothetical protein